MQRIRDPTSWQTGGCSARSRRIGEHATGDKETGEKKQARKQQRTGEKKQNSKKRNNSQRKEETKVKKKRKDDTNTNHQQDSDPPNQKSKAARPGQARPGQDQIPQLKSHLEKAEKPRVYWTLQRSRWIMDQGG